MTAAERRCPMCAGRGIIANNEAALVTVTRHINPGGGDHYTFTWDDPDGVGWTAITREALEALVDLANGGQS